MTAAKSSPPGARPGILWWLLAAAATAVGIYGMLMQDARANGGMVPGMPWLDAVHFVAGGLALTIGIWGFRRDVLARWPGLHRRVGQLYVLAVLASGTAGLAMACYSLGGLAGHIGFAMLAIGWLGTTALGWQRIHHRKIAAHRRWMVRSYALSCAAITLRIQLGPLVMMTGSSAAAFQIVSFSCWVPNLLFAEWWLRRDRRRR
ncbi:MAG: DUF2306 domain-containing protein [Planctomycetota bacterium]